MTVIKDAVRFDIAAIKNPVITPEGYLKCDAVIVAKAGTLEYEVRPDGKPGMRTDFISADELGRADSIESLKMLPILNGHPRDLPKGFINSETVKGRAIGHVGEVIKMDGDSLVASIIITDAGAVQDYKNGKRGLSLGYLADLMVTPGTFGGRKYDFVQTNRRYNHLALVNRGRAGEDAKIPDLVNMDGIEKEPDNLNPYQRRTVMTVAICIDGITYNDQAPEVDRHIKKLAADLEEEKKKVTTLTANLDAKTAELDASKTKVTDLEKKVSEIPTQIADGVKARSSLVALVSPFLDEETKKAIDGMADIDLKRTIATKAFPTLAEKIKAGSPEYLAPLFDSAIETLKEKEPDAGNAGQRKAANGGKTHVADEEKEPTAEEAHQKMVERTKGLYKGANADGCGKEKK